MSGYKIDRLKQKGYFMEMEQDEFQFKPINEGLGFHKKKPIIKLDLNEDKETQALSLVENTSSDVETTDQNNKKLANLFEDSHSKPHSVLQNEQSIPSITDPNVQFEPASEIDKNVFEKSRHVVHNDIFSSVTRPQAPQTQSTTSPSVSDSPSTAISPESVPPPPPPNRIPTSSLSADTADVAYSASYSTHTSQSLAKQNTLALDRTQYVAPHLGSLLLDLFAVIGLLHIFIVPLLLITQVNTSYILTNIQSDPALQLSLTILFLAVLNFYLMTARSFFGSTMGEWACDMTLGTLEQRQSPIYPILVAWRCFIMTITGLVFLPLLGWIARRDLLGKLTFVRLVRS